LIKIRTGDTLTLIQHSHVHYEYSVASLPLELCQP
jgi:hypothetical protein